MPPYYLPLIHPAALVRGLWHEEPAQVAYLKRAKQLLDGEWTPPDVGMVPPNSLVRPSLQTLMVFDTQVTSGNWDCLSIDIETAGNYIILVGLTLMDMRAGAIGLSLSLPFKGRFGERYWPDRVEHGDAVEMLGMWLADPRLGKLFHNGVSFDVPMLEETGFTVEGDLYDTMVMQHYAYPEWRKGLAYCSTLYLGMPNWKVLLDEDDETEGKA